MKKRTIAATFLIGALVMGVSACGQSNSAQAPQSDTTSASPANSDQANNSAASDPAQKAARAQKREAIRKQISAVLTPDQAQQFQTKLQNGEKMRQALNELNLTADQKTKIQDILKTAYPRQQGEQKS